MFFIRCFYLLNCYCFFGVFGVTLKNCEEVIRVEGVEPIHYDLDLTFGGLRESDRDKNGRFSVNGRVHIEAFATSSLCNVMLHHGPSEYLQVQRAKVNK